MSMADAFRLCLYSTPKSTLLSLIFISVLVIDNDHNEADDCSVCLICFYNDRNNSLRCGMGELFQ